MEVCTDECRSKAPGFLVFHGACLEPKEPRYLQAMCCGGYVKISGQRKMYEAWGEVENQAVGVEMGETLLKNA
jgi:hypothetical protein